jgi:D-alanyl-D-alanine carboxypeptidase
LADPLADFKIRLVRDAAESRLFKIAIPRHASAQLASTPLDSHDAKPLALQRTFVPETIEELIACVPGFGSEVAEDGSLVDVRGRYHPRWCAPRVVSSTPAEITLTFNALFSGQLLAAETLRRMLTLVPLSGLQEPPMAIDGGMGLFSNAASPYGWNYGHGGGGPGYDLTAGVYLDASGGHVAVAVFVDTSSGPRAGDLEYVWSDKFSARRIS